MLFVGIIVTLSSLSNSYSFLSSSKNIVYSTVSNYIQPLLNTFNKNSNVKQPVLINDGTLNIDKCNNNPKIANLDSSSDTQLKKLSQLQSICDSSASSNLMVFTEMPNSEISASRLATSLAAKLKEFKKYNITPIVVVEPITSWGLVDFAEFNTGFYNDWIISFFNRLKVEGIKEEDLGLWVPFPEANLPYWNKGDSKPEIFGSNINLYSKLIRKVYPKARLSILLNSVSYPSIDDKWENGKYLSLIPYIKDIKPNTIESFGIQGFPWRSPKNVKLPTQIYDPLEFLNTKIAIESAEYLKLKSIWINTGTFRSKYTNDPTMIVTESSKIRSEILDEIINQALELKKKDYSVSINLFSQNKTDTSEATDWSYWGTSAKDTDQHTVILKKFIQKLDTNKIIFWYFN